jgi:phosphatidylglycerol---prolipoprotein diacylglyceryl transferase
VIPSPSNPILFQIGPVNIGWYGVGYVIGVGVLLLIAQREARRRGYDPNHIWNALLLVGALALIGGRMYHVIDQWGACGLGEPCYSQNLARIFLPPYSGLGLYGGVAGAALGILIYTRWKHLPLRLALDVVVPGALFAQGIARWGNYFNQELYGPPTNLPWGIQIDCAHRVAEWPCSLYPAATTGFQPLFFYESALDITGGLIALYISWRFLPRLIPGDLAAFWAIWYGTVRSLLETFRAGWNWTVGGLPTAQWIGLGIVLVGVVWLIYNHRPGHRGYEYRAPFQEQPPPNSDSSLEPSD